MTHDVMLHIDEKLTADQREELELYLSERLGVESRGHDSGKPHLIFLNADPVSAPPHELVRLVRERGYHAQLVDL